MTNQPENPHVLFDVYGNTFDDLDEPQMKAKGWFMAQVEFRGGDRYTLLFYDPVRLRQDLDSLLEQGDPCLAEPNIIVVPEVTVRSIRASLPFLLRSGYFVGLKPARAGT